MKQKLDDLFMYAFVALLLTLWVMVFVAPSFAGPDDILVKLRGPAPQALASQGRLVQRFERMGIEHWTIDGDRWGVIEALRRHPAVEYAEPDLPIYADAVPNDPRFAEQYGLHNTGQSAGKVDADIDAPEAWDVFPGSGVVVAIIDSGADIAHPDLAANLWTNNGEVPDNGVDDDRNGFVDDVNGYDFRWNKGDVRDTLGHGTHTAGTVGAVTGNGIGVAGTCPNVRLMILKFFDGNGIGFSSGAIAAIDYSILMGARLSSNSWSVSASQLPYLPLRDAVERSRQAGQLFVCAAANNGMDIDCARQCPGVFVPQPAALDLDNLLVVAATDRNDLMASFSNFGSVSVDLGAPGVSVLSTYPFIRDATGYKSLSGTSMACPHTAGAAALVWGRNPSLTAAQVKNLLMQSVDPLPALAQKTVSGGRLNLWKAVSGIPPAQVRMLNR